MKICITAQDQNLDAQVDPKFGRCTYFIIADPDTLDFEVINNSNTISTGGAGIQSGQVMSEKGVKAVLTGDAGPNAFQILNAANIAVITGVTGTIKEAITKYNNGEYKTMNEPSVHSHHGMQRE